MSEPSTNFPSPDGLLGLASALGALQSDFKHYREDLSRAFAELRSEFSDYGEQITALEEARTDDRARLDKALAIFEKALAGIEENVSRNANTPTKPIPTVANATPPARKEREQTSAYHTRLAAFADEHGFPPPPKPKSLEDRVSYDRRVSAWGAALSA